MSFTKFLRAPFFNDQCPFRIETSQLICRASQLAGFYERGILFVKGLKVHPVAGSVIFMIHHFQEIMAKLSLSLYH